MKFFPHQGCFGFISDGIGGELFLKLVVRVVAHIADSAPVYDRRFFFFREEFVELRIIAGCNDQCIDRPFIAVDFDHAVLNDPQVDLDQVFFVFIDFIAEVDTPAGNSCQSPPSQVEPVWIVGVADVKQ